MFSLLETNKSSQAGERYLTLLKWAQKYKAVYLKCHLHNCATKIKDNLKIDGMGAKQPPNWIFQKININNINMLSKMGKPQNNLNLHLSINQGN